MCVCVYRFSAAYPSKDVSIYNKSAARVNAKACLFFLSPKREITK